MHRLRLPASFRIRRAGPIAVMLVAVALGAPSLLASESHFTDVPPSNPFYTNINNVAGAGITAGCAATKYCPKSDVTREQMAAFLNRAAPRFAIAYLAHPLGNTPGQQPANNALVASTPIRAIGYEAILIRANFYTIVYAGSGTFPCEVRYRFRIDGVVVGDPVMYVRDVVAPPSTWLTRPMTGEYAIVVGPGDHTVSMIYQRVTSTCSSYPGNGTLVVEPIPFRWDLGTFGFGEELPVFDGSSAVEGPMLQSNGSPAR